MRGAGRVTTFEFQPATQHRRLRSGEEAEYFSVPDIPMFMPKDVHGEETPADHMLVCLPALSKAYGNDFVWSSGRWLMLDVSCTLIVSRCGGSLPKTLQVQMRGFGGEDNSIVYFNSQARVAPSEEGVWKPEELNLQGTLLRCLPTSFDTGKDGACFKQVMHPLGGSQCIGVACLRDEAGTGCRGLPSCVQGVSSWLRGFPAPYVSRPQPVPVTWLGVLASVYEQWLSFPLSIFEHGTHAVYLLTQPGCYSLGCWGAPPLALLGLT